MMEVVSVGLVEAVAEAGVVPEDMQEEALTVVVAEDKLEASVVVPVVVVV